MEQGTYADCQPKSLSVLTVPRQQGDARSCQHLNIGKSETSSLGSPKKSCGIVGNCGFPLLTLCWAREMKLRNLPAQATASVLLQVARLLDRQNRSQSFGESHLKTWEHWAMWTSPGRSWELYLLLLVILCYAMSGFKKEYILKIKIICKMGMHI